MARTTQSSFGPRTGQPSHLLLDDPDGISASLSCAGRPLQHALRLPRHGPLGLPGLSRHELYTEPAHAVAYPDAAGRPIPTLRWEAMRDGIDDVRYLQALDRAIAAAEARMAEDNPPADLAAALEHANQIRQECYESIGGRWFHYIGGLLPGDLDQVRRRLADAAVAPSHAEQ